MGAGGLFQQCGWLHCQRVGNLFEDQDRRVPNASFHATYISAMKIALECELFLGKPLLLPVFPDVFSDPFPNIHPTRGRKCSFLIYRL